MVMRSIGARAAVEISCHRSVGEIQARVPPMPIPATISAPMSRRSTSSRSPS